MGSVRDIQVAEINRAAKWIRTNLLRLRKARSRLGSAGPPPEKLIADMNAMRSHLTELVANSVARADDEDLAHVVRIARQVLDDCDEMINLLR
jgi:hypothetical protein